MKVADRRLRKTKLVTIPITMPKLGGIVLNVPYYKQEQTNWCWAACAQMNVLFRKGNSPSQCSYANMLFQQSGCCVTPDSSLCNRPCQVRDVAAIYSSQAVHSFEVNGQVAFSTLQGELNAGRSVEVAYAWNGGGGHVAIVKGWGQNQQGDFVMVNDPAYGSGGVYYNKLQTAYDQGNWFFTWTGIS